MKLDEALKRWAIQHNHGTEEQIDKVLIDYSEGFPGYSEWTPGQPAMIDVTIMYKPEHHGVLGVYSKIIEIYDDDNFKKFIGAAVCKYTTKDT